MKKKKLLSIFIQAEGFIRGVIITNYELSITNYSDFPGQRWRTHGDTYESAVANGTEALQSLVMAYQATGEPLPEPTVNKAA